MKLLFIPIFRRLALLAWMLIAFGTASASTLNLTGATIYSIDQTGRYTGHGWDTVGANGSYNLYLLTGSYIFLTSGDDAATSPNIDLSVPGTYTFLLRADGGGFNWDTSFTGLSLFFNKSSTPGISVSIPFNVALPALKPLGTPGLGLLKGGVVPGANSLSFVLDNAKVTLTAFNWINYRNPAVAPKHPDLVGPKDNNSNGINDYSGSITLLVTPASPVPPTQGIDSSCGKEKSKAQSCVSSKKPASSQELAHHPI